MKRSVSIAFYLACLWIGCTVSAQAQDFSAYQKKYFVADGDTMPYRVLLPEAFDSTKQYPLLLFLHGRGERGTDNEAQLIHGGNVFLYAAFRSTFKAIVVFPQCSPEGYWSNVTRNETAPELQQRFVYHKGGRPTRDMRMLIQLFRNIRSHYPVNNQRLYVGGLSMGGMGTFELVRRLPNSFAAAFAICGGAHPGIARKLKTVHWRVYHGLKDDVVLPSFSERMVAAMKKKGVDVTLTLFPEANHNAWDPALADPSLFPWLFAQQR
ncbi:MAG TPA: prolyl oligopeptidase family serine peptidase [Ferruginibacter sp.]|nr:prolyl oligopeptidase family serine peptidase [Ferruginibacter sp.]